MTKRVVSGPGAPRAIGPYSPAIAAQGFLFLSGQIALDPATGALEAGGAEAQARRCMENLKAVLDAAGSRLERVVKTTLFLVDMADFEGVNRVYGGYFPGEPPARTTVQVSALPRGARVEIDAIALA